MCSRSTDYFCPSNPFQTMLLHTVNAGSMPAAHCLLLSACVKPVAMQNFNSLARGPCEKQTQLLACCLAIHRPDCIAVRHGRSHLLGQCKLAVGGRQMLFMALRRQPVSDCMCMWACRRVGYNQTWPATAGLSAHVLSSWSSGWASGDLSHDEILQYTLACALLPLQ